MRFDRTPVSVPPRIIQSHANGMASLRRVVAFIDDTRRDMAPDTLRRVVAFIDAEKADATGYTNGYLTVLSEDMAELAGSEGKLAFVAGYLESLAIDMPEDIALIA